MHKNVIHTNALRAAEDLYCVKQAVLWLRLGYFQLYRHESSNLLYTIWWVQFEYQTTRCLLIIILPASLRINYLLLFFFFWALSLHVLFSHESFFHSCLFFFPHSISRLSQHFKGLSKLFITSFFPHLLLSLKKFHLPRTFLSIFFFFSHGWNFLRHFRASCCREGMLYPSEEGLSSCELVKRKPSCHERPFNGVG